MRLAQGNFTKLSIKGGVIGVYITWNCDLDWSFDDYCLPTYSFRILDTFGWNFRHAHYHEENRRTLVKAYGLKFLVVVDGRASKFDLTFVFQPMEEVAVVYGIVTGSLCYLLSWIGIMLGLILIHRLFQAEKKKERKALRGREQTNKLAEPALFMMAMHHNVHFWNEVKSTGIVLGLIVIYLFLMLPYVIRVKVDQILQDYNHDYYRNLTLAYYLIPAENTTVNTTIMPPTSTGVVSLTTLLDTSGNDTLEDQSDVELVEHNPLLVPEVQEEFLGVIDVVCIWLR